MALPDLTGQNIENTYQRVLQTDGTIIYDGTGSIFLPVSASYSVTASYAEYAVSASHEIVKEVSSSYADYAKESGLATSSISASYALTASYALNSPDVFPYTGSAIISGSLVVTGSTEIQYLTASGLNYPAIDGDEKQLITTDGSGNLFFDWSDRTNLDVKNTSGTTLALGTPVYISGFQGASIFQISPSSASISSSMPAVGILSQELAPNEQGHATILGALRGYNTSLCSVNDSLYVGEGILTKDRPTGSVLIQKIARVGNSQNNGEITIIGAGRSNDIPNLPPGYAWIGNENWVATAVPTSSFNEDPFPYTGSAAISGALEVTGDVTIYGTASVNVLVTNYESSSIIYSSGSTKFGDSLDDTHIFTGSVSVTGSLDVIGDTNITGSLTTSGSIVDFSLASSINLGLQPSFKSTGLFLVDTTVNYNVTTAIAVQFNQIEYNQGNSLTPETGSATKITVSEAGYYQVDALVAFNVGGQRTTPGMNVYVDGVEVEGRAYGYIRNASGADEASCTISRVIYLPNGNEQVEIRVANYATSATCNAQQGYFQLTKVDNPALQGPVGPVGPAGQAGTSFSVSLESTGRTLALSDNLTYIKCSPSSPGATYTVPPQSDVSWPDSCEVAFEQGNAFPITIAAGSGVTVNSSATLVTSGQNAVIALKRVNTDTWTLTGERATT